MHNRAEGRIRANAAVEIGLIATRVDDLPAQFECDSSEVGLRFRPSCVNRRDFAHDADQARIAMTDGYQMTDGPILALRITTTGDDALGSIQRHQMSNDAPRRSFPAFGAASFVQDCRAGRLIRELGALQKLLKLRVRRTGDGDPAT